MQDLRVAVVSSRSEFADTQTNMANILAWIDKAADERADLVHRFGVLAAVAGLVAVLALWRRRRRTD